MSAPVAPLTLKDKVKETPEQKAARKAAQAAMTPEQRAAYVLEKEKLKAKEAEEKAKLQAAKGHLLNSPDNVTFERFSLCYEFHVLLF